MKKKIIIITVAFVAFILAYGVVIVATHASHSKESERSWKEKAFAFTGTAEEVALNGDEVVGINLEGEAVYLTTSTQDGHLQINYRSLTNLNQDVNVYTSRYVVVEHNVYPFDDGILLLETYYDEAQEMTFCLTRLTYRNSESQMNILYREICDQMPYVTIANISDKYDSARIPPHILLNYDNNGMSHLVLLRHDKGAGFEPTIINSGVYGRYEEGTIENGRKILFAGGYGDYVYYQVLYNSVGDPPPEVATFEATGTSVLFRYNIRTEEITRVMDLNKKALHINAGGSYALISEYDYDAPLMDSGKLISLSNGRTDYIIPGVESGIDIGASRFIEEDKVVFYTPKKLYLADLDNCVLHTYDLDDNAQVWLEQEGVHLVHSSNEQAEIQYITYGDVFDRD